MKNSITFVSNRRPATEVLHLSCEGITANPDIPVDEAAKAVLDALDANIKVMVQKAVEAERKACAKLCEWKTGLKPVDTAIETCAAAIRARSES